MESTKNIGIWIRVSTEMQVQGDSPEHHEKRARLYAEAKGWHVVTVYRLDAMSGKSVMDYPETKRMLKDIKEGVISGLVFSKLARLARNTKELLEIAEIFRNYDADLISLAESIDTSTPAGRLFYTMIAAMAQWERDEIAERVAASVPIRAKLGKPLGGQASFGYRWDGHTLTVDEQEAPIRKQLYEIFLKTKRKKATARELNDLGYRTRNGSKFSTSTITRLLREPTAKGIRRANYTQSTGAGKHWVAKDKTEWVEMPCPAIVSDEVWDNCNAILLEQEQKRAPRGPRPVFLLAGFVQCNCGNKMYVYHTAPAYSCKKCRRKIAVADIDEIYHQQLKSFLLTDTDLESIARQSNAVLQEKETLLKSTMHEYGRLKKRMEDLVNLRLNNEMTKEDFAQFYQPVQEQVRQLETQMPELEAEIDFLKIEYLSAGTVQQDAKDLYNNWPELPFEEKRSIVEHITEHIVIHNDTIDISFSYSPRPPLLKKDGKRGRNRNTAAAVLLNPLKKSII